ncbi:MAG: TolC family protein [Alphaproteobacteria bacterium]|nr:TolC family protein [Alphaproteobacteria bacterium]
MTKLFNIALTAFLAFGFSACATYKPLPLEAEPHLAASLEALQKAPVSRPLSMADVVRLAVQYNPDLKAARAARAIAHAEVVQAGLLPNPQFGGSYGFFISGPAFADAYNLGLGEDIKALVTRGATRDAAEYNARKVDADLLWQEWQVIGKARLLDVDLAEMQKMRSVLRRSRDLLADRYRRSHAALLRGDMDLSATAPDLAARGDMDKQLGDLDRQIQAKWQEMDALLGLEPDVRFPLNPDIPVLKIDRASADKILPKLLPARPDLAALRWGYQSQEEKTRAAILGQFPALVFGGNYGSDTSEVFSGGPQITLDLPIFNRNQGAIAAQRATRRKLHDEYDNRLNAAEGEAEAMMQARILLWKQFAETKYALQAARRAAAQAQAAFKAGNIDERSYVDLQMVALNQHQRMIDLHRAMLEQQVALATLLGVGMPTVKPLAANGEAP